MAFPASSVSKERAWSEIRAIAVRIKGQVQSLRNASAAAPTGRTSYIALQRTLALAVISWDTLAVVPGLQDYARDQITDPTLNLAAEYSAMRTGAIALQGWIFTNIPRDVSGAVLTHTVDASGIQTELTVSVAGAAGFRTQADAFIATID